MIDLFSFGEDDFNASLYSLDEKEERKSSTNVSVLPLLCSLRIKSTGDEKSISRGVCAASFFFCRRYSR